MSIKAVVELSNELRRLAIAGSDLAIGDARVAAIVPTLRKSGAKVPVFAKIADTTRALLEADRASAPGHLLKLNVLVVAVLKTQGKVGVDGELAALPPMSMTSRNLPARTVEALREAVDASDVHALRNAAKRGLFGDVRLLPIAIDALMSSHAEVANLAARKLVPPFGKSVVPLLIAELDLSLKRPAARLIEAVAAADPETGAALARQILDPAAERVFALKPHEGVVSDEATLAALGCLGERGSDLVRLRDALGARKKAVRRVALCRLLALGDEEATARCVTMLGGPKAKTREAIEAIEAMSDAPAEAVSDALLALVADPIDRLDRNPRKITNSVLDVNTPADVKLVETVAVLLARFGPSPERLAFLVRVLENACVSRRRFVDLRSNGIGSLIDHVVRHVDEERVEAVVRLAIEEDACRTMTAVVDRFGTRDAPEFLGRLDRRLVADGLMRSFPGDFRSGFHPDDALAKSENWGEGWLDLGLKLEVPGLVGHVWRRNPSLVIDEVFCMLRHNVERFAVIALCADPRRADDVKARLQKKSSLVGGHRGRERAHEALCTLCDSIAAGDIEQGLSTIPSLRRHYPPGELSDLHECLKAYVPETRS